MSSFLAKIAAKALDTCLSLAAEAAEVAVAKGVDAAYHWVTSVKSPPVPVNEESELTANPIVFVDVLAEPISTILVLVEPTAELGPSIDVNVDEEVNEPVAEPLAPSPVTKHDDGECAICRETHVNKSYPPCRHVFCFDCLKRWCLAVNCSMIKCPICRERFKSFKHDIQSDEIFEVYDLVPLPSLDCLVYFIEEEEEESRTLLALFSTLSYGKKVLWVACAASVVPCILGLSFIGYSCLHTAPDFATEILIQRILH